MIQSPQLVRHCAWAIKHETEIKFIIIIIIIIIIVFPLHFAWFVSGSWGFINLLSPHNRCNRPFACCARTGHWRYTSAILNSTKKIIVSFVLDRLPEMSANSEEVCKTLTKCAWRSEGSGIFCRRLCSRTFRHISRSWMLFIERKMFSIDV